MKPSWPPRLTLTRRDDGWWIIGCPFVDSREHGPYATRADADSDRVGLNRHYAAAADFYLSLESSIGADDVATAEPSCEPSWQPEDEVALAVALGHQKEFVF